MLDAVFVHPNASKKIYQELSNKHSAIEPPIWAGMLANSMRHSGLDVSIIDAEAEGLDYITCAGRIVDSESELAIFVVYGQQPSASTQNMVGAVATADYLKKINPSIKVLFVGGHIAALPYDTLLKHDSIDFICQNEGVYTIRDLIKARKECSWGGVKFDKIRGLGYKKNGSPILNSHSVIVPSKSLDVELPGIAWDMLPSFDKYRTAGWHSWSNGSEKTPFAALYTSLGCPFRCSFCMINIVNKTRGGLDVTSEASNVYRSWSVDFVIKQMDYFAHAGVKNIKIADELFVLKPSHFVEICKIISDRGYDFNIWAYSRVDTCKDEYLEVLRKAGVKWLGVGIENPDDEIRMSAHKDSFKKVGIREQLSKIREWDINIGGNYIFGLPNDTMESMRSTLDFALENMTEMANFYTAMAYPGSPLYNDAVKKGLELPSSYEGYSQHAYETQNLSNENLSAAEILRFRDYAWSEYHSSSMFQEYLKKRFGKEAKDNLEATLKIRLKRKILGD